MKYFFKATFCCLLILPSILCFTAEDKIKTCCYSIGDIVHSSNNSYTILKKLGEGAFGEVYSVESSDGQQFALKTYKLLSWEHYLMDSEREFSIGQSLDHPNIIKSVDLFTSRFSPEFEVKNLILELVPGKILGRTKSSTLSVEVATENIIQLCKALKYAISLGLIYMDLHEGNIMIKEGSSDIMIIDIASFSTFDELRRCYKFFNMYESSPKALNPFLGSTQIARPKLNKFFMENPKLLMKLLKNEDSVGTSVKEQKNLANLNFSIASSVEDKKTKRFQQLMCQDYFDDITDISIQVLRKSNLSKNKKISFRGEIKKLSWDYEEDTELDCNLSFEEYMDKLIEMIENYKDNSISEENAKLML